MSVTNGVAPWPALGVAGRAVIADDRGRILLLQRGLESRTEAGRYELPGGKLSHGERLDDAVVREVEEETGLVVQVGSPLQVSHVVRGPFWVTTVTFLAEADASAVRLSPEHAGCCWVDPDDLGTLELAEAADEQIAAYRAMRKRRKKR